MESVGTDHELYQFIEERAYFREGIALIRKESASDPAHDLSHIARVLNNAWQIAQVEGGDLEVIVAASLLHDVKNLPKSHPEARKSSSLSAEFAVDFLQKLGFPEKKLSAVHDAMCATVSLGARTK